MQYPAVQHYDHNPYGPNPLTRGQKIGLIVGGAAVVTVVGAVIWSNVAKAEVVPLTPPGPSPTPPKPSAKRPAGHPPPFGKSCYPPQYGGSNRYDSSFWEQGGTAIARQRIFDLFQRFGYATPGGRDTMNELGPDASLGGGDDVPNEQVRSFQKDYNAVSRSGKFGESAPRQKMGGLDPDGFVGPCTLNALRFIELELEAKGIDDWQDVVQAAKDRGFTP